jgi:pimeloyl-ACP methyl ester carboxylesterase
MMVTTASAASAASAKTLRVDDVSLAYAVTGTGPAVLCVQGVGVAGSGWGPQVPALAERYRVITFDNRGIGATPRGAGALTIERMAADARAILDAEGIERCHVVGHSMGGLIALALALAAPARVLSLSMLCTFADGAGPTRPSGRMIVLGLRSRIGTRTMRRLAMQDMLFTPEWLRGRDRAALAEALNALFGRDLGVSAPIVDEQLKVMGRYDATPQLARLSGIPALVVSGRHDPIAPPVLGRAIAQGIGGARYVELEDASHALVIQAADRVNALLRDHLDAVR